MQLYDVAIIGSGPEGLVAGAMLARAGVSVVVLERKSVIGGRAATVEFHPGFCASPYADELAADAISGRAVSPLLAGTALHLLSAGAGRSGMAPGGLRALGAGLAAAAQGAGQAQSTLSRPKRPRPISASSGRFSASPAACGRGGVPARPPTMSFAKIPPPLSHAALAFPFRTGSSSTACRRRSPARLCCSSGGTPRRVVAGRLRSANRKEALWGS